MDVRLGTDRCGDKTEEENRSRSFHLRALPDTNNEERQRVRLDGDNDIGRCDVLQIICRLSRMTGSAYRQPKLAATVLRVVRSATRGLVDPDAVTRPQDEHLSDTERNL